MIVYGMGEQHIEVISKKVDEQVWSRMHLDRPNCTL